MLILLLLVALATFAQNPWVGGLNACQFGRLDLNQDGKKDLLVFDRHGNRLLCFINEGGEGEINYRYTMDYDDAFPKMKDWVVFADYDADGREDIFSYSKGWAGIKVYRNVSTPEHLGFDPVVEPYLTSWQGGGEVNILATEADYPAIVDLDGDGDLDILTFGVMGTFIEKHLNLSVERYGCRDSLVFEKVDLCWGRVAESEEDNVMYLDTCLFGYGVTMDKEDFRHRGSTVTLRDLTGDGLPDLLLADVDYPGLTLLVNGGDEENALMVSQTEQFPQSKPVVLPSMPVPFFTDINNDGLDDLLVSPFDPNPMASDGLGSVWLYINHGTNELPDFQFYTQSFLQSTMLDFGKSAYPVAVDWDGDGLLDLMVGSVDGGLTWLHNMGSVAQPVFSIEFLRWRGLEGKRGLVPAFADLDGDGQLECLVGTDAGTLLLFDHEGSLLDDDYLHYDKPWSAPCFYDVDQDGTVDLVVGNATGRLSFGHDDFWGEVDVRDYGSSYYGYSVPFLFQWGDEILLAVGSESGKVFLFDGVTTAEGAAFRDATERWGELCESFPREFGMRSAATVADINVDGRPEIVVGNFGGGLQLYNATIPVNDLGISEQQEDVEVLIFPNPVSSQLHVVVPTPCECNEVRITDLFGRIVLKEEMAYLETTVDVSDLASGVYLLSLSLDCGLVNRIFLKR